MASVKRRLKMMANSSNESVDVRYWDQVWVRIKIRPLVEARRRLHPEAQTKPPDVKLASDLRGLWLFLAGDTAPTLVTSDELLCRDCADDVQARALAHPGEERRRVVDWCRQIHRAYRGALAAGDRPLIQRLSRARELACLLQTLGADPAFADGLGVAMRFAALGHTESHDTLCSLATRRPIKPGSPPIIDGRMRLRKYLRGKARRGDCLARSVVGRIAAIEPGAERDWLFDQIEKGDSTFFDVLAELVKTNEKIALMLFPPVFVRNLSNEHLVAALIHHVRRVVRRVVPWFDNRAGSERDDLVQDVAWAVIRRFRDQPARVEAQAGRSISDWNGLLRTIASRATVKALRRTHRERDLLASIKSLAQAPRASDPADGFVRLDYREYFQTFINQVLAPRDKKVLEGSAQADNARPWTAVGLTPQEFRAYAARLPLASDQRIFEVWIAEQIRITSRSPLAEPWEQLGLSRSAYFKHSRRLADEFRKWHDDTLPPNTPSDPSNRGGSPSPSGSPTTPGAGSGGVPSSPNGSFLRSGAAAMYQTVFTPERHLSPAEIAALIRAAVQDEAVAGLGSIEEHLESCDACREALAFAIGEYRDAAPPAADSSRAPGLVTRCAPDHDTQAVTTEKAAPSLAFSGFCERDTSPRPSCIGERDARSGETAVLCHERAVSSPIFPKHALMIAASLLVFVAVGSLALRTWMDAGMKRYTDAAAQGARINAKPWLSEEAVFASRALLSRDPGPRVLGADGDLQTQLDAFRASRRLDSEVRSRLLAVEGHEAALSASSRHATPGQEPPAPTKLIAPMAPEIATDLERARGVAERTHIVKRDESLGEIALRECGSVRMVDELVRINGIANPNLIKVGQVLRLPQEEPRGSRVERSVRR